MMERFVPINVEVQIERFVGPDTPVAKGTQQSDQQFIGVQNEQFKIIKVID
jgi:hypothetical protein